MFNLQPLLAAATETASRQPMAWQSIASTIIYSVIGIAMFVLAYWVFDRITPFSVHREISEDQNMALAIIIGAMMIALAIIVHGAIS